MTPQMTDMDVLLLAAGMSTRMGSANKLLLEYAGQPLVRHTAATLLNSGFSHITVVTGFEADAVAGALDGLAVSLSFNPNFQSGQMSSVTHGLRAIASSKPRARSHVMICLADMPYLEKSDYQALVAAFAAKDETRIALPVYAGQRGNPIILPKRLLDEASLGGLNTGCRHLIDRRPEEVDRIPVKNSAFVRDIDTPPDYDNALRAAFPGAPCCG